MPMPRTKQDDEPGRAPVLVTGATSALGRALAYRLASMGHEVRALLRRHPSQHQEWKALPKGVKVYIGDVSEPSEGLREACSGVSIMFHVAGVTRNYTAYESRKPGINTMINTNVVGTENMLDAFVGANPGRKLRVIYASSMAVYGHKRPGEVLTEESRATPDDRYGRSKLMAEQVISQFSMAHRNLSYTVFRIGVIYGQGYDENFNQVYRLISEGRMRYIGNGENHLTLVHIDDVVDSMIAAAFSDKARDRTYNLTDGVPYTQIGLINKAARLIGSKKEIKGIHPILARIGAKAKGIDEEQMMFLISDRIVSIKRAKADLGFSPRHTIDSEGARMAREFKKATRKR